MRAYRTTPKVTGVIAVLLLVAPPLWGQTSTESPPPNALVTITGGPDTTGHNYTWTVTNHHDTAITAIAFPHYRADTFTPPEGWTGDMTNFRGHGGKEGLCSGKAEAPGAAIAPGSSAEFYLRVAPKGAKRGTRKARVSFEDGREVLVQVETPIREPFLERNMTLVGLSVMFAIFLLVARLRRKPVPETSEDSTVG